MNSWLVKSEPSAYSFAQFAREKKTDWTGVRNFAARNFMRAMSKGDEVFFYHSMTEKAVVGLAKVSKTAFADPTADPDEKGEWSCVELTAGKPLPRPVTLAQIKMTPALKKMELLRQSRLSVIPVRTDEAALLRKLGGL